MDDPLLTLALIAVFLLWFLVGSWRDRRREALLEREAKRLGLDFQRRGELEGIPGHADFQLFQTGRDRSVRSLVHGGSQGNEATAFNFRYTEGLGDSSSTTTQTVVLMDFTRPVARFELCPESVMHKLSAAVGFQDIDFGGHPRFSEKYVLRGDDVAAIRGAFTDDVLDMFASHPGYCAESSGRQLLIYREGQEVAPSDLGGLLRVSREVRDVLVGQLPNAAVGA